MTYAPIEAFVAVDEPGAEPLAQGEDGGSVIPARGLIVTYGNGGVGKTTKEIDLVFHLAAGLSWHDIVTPATPVTTVLVENEGPRPELRKKLGRKLAAWGGPSVAGRIYVFEHPWESFSFRDSNVVSELIEFALEVEAKLIVAGPVKTIGMKGAGTDDDIAEFLAEVNIVREATGAAVSLIHHENRAGQISGAWESRPDTLIHVQGQGHGRTRVYWQKARWCSALHGRSTQLLWAPGESYTVEDKPELDDDAVADKILAAALANGGGSWNKLDEKIDGKNDRKRAIRDRLLAGGRLIDTGGKAGMKLWHVDDPARPVVQEELSPNGGALGAQL